MSFISRETIRTILKMDTDDFELQLRKGNFMRDSVIMGRR